MLNKAVAEYLRANRPGHVEKLLELLRFASTANNPGACRRCAQWLADYLGELGLSSQVMPTGGKDAVYAASSADPAKPTVLIYGHYDVQPPDPLAEWKSKPFQPVIRDGNIYARGASDDKGQMFAHLMAMEAWARGGGELPVNVKVLIEGEEEVGSPSFEPFVAEHGELLACDAAVISDSAFFAPALPSLLTGLRGLAYVEVTFTGPKADAHSGTYGGLLTNPINALAKLVGALHDADGRVTIPGFYDDVVTIDEAQRRQWAALPFDEAEHAASMGVGALGGGEHGYGPLERCWARPTLDCNGMVGGYTDLGAKTIIPARATAKISMRLVAHQKPAKIVASFRQFVAEHTPPGIRGCLEEHSTARPVLLKADGPAMAAARAALRAAFGAEPVLIGCGASVPVTELIQRLLGVDPAMMGFGLPDDRHHSPNEKFALEHLYKGAEASAMFLDELAARADQLRVAGGA